MPTFQYKHGDKPLDGYTIQHGVGRGGFGEVYYALSDAGREVALKAVQGYEDIELRGIRHCMNLKSPHLVSIFDVRHNADNRPFVIMEYVSGPSLRDLLDESPAGIGEQKAAFFLREIAKGLSYLHNAGIVHRDMKPGNIFYEDGYVKIGDYGLSKAMTASIHSGQTITVGTMHYMAPEIGQGKYDRSIDIYALGCMLYEMLTGTTPFFGSSPSEILMKHLSAEPDYSALNEPFRTALRRALAKDPAERYQNVQQMVETVFGSEHVQQSVSAFTPASLSMVAGKAGAKVRGPSGGGIATSDSGPTANEEKGDSWANTFNGKAAAVGDRLRDASAKVDERMNAAADRVRARLDDRYAAGTPDTGPKDKYKAGKRKPLVKPRHIADVRYDPMNAGSRLTLSVLTGAVMALAIGLLNPTWLQSPVASGIFTFVTSVGAAVGVTMLRRHFVAGYAADSKGSRRLAYAVAGTAGAGLAGVSVLMERGVMPDLASILLWLLAPMFLINWQKLTCVWRKDRLTLSPVIWGAVLGALTGWITSNDPLTMMGVMATAVLVSQVAAPWDPTARHRAKAMNAARRGEAETVARPIGTSAPPLNPIGELNISPHKRLWSMLLAGGWFFGFCGLHRFYVGKVWTGLLWFFTGGLLGIGQLVDVILIANGTFRDSSGRKLVMWESYDELRHLPRQTMEQLRREADNRAWGSRDDDDRAPVTVQPVGDEYQPVAAPGGNPLLSVFNGILLVTVVVLGTALALDVPYLLDVNVPGNDVRDELAQFFGAPNWASTLEQVGRFVVLGLGGLLALGVLFNRRRVGWGHCGRALLALAGIGAALVTLNTAVIGVEWETVVALLDQGLIGPAINDLFAHVNEGRFVIAGVLMVASLTVLAWPPQARPRHDDGDTDMRQARGA